MTETTPRTPAEALRWAAERIAPNGLDDLPARTVHVATAGQLRRWADELDAAPAAPCGCRTADEHAKVTAAFGGESDAAPAGDWLGEEFEQADKVMDGLPAWAQPVVTRAAPDAARAADPGPAAPTTPDELTAEADLLAAIDNALRNGSYMTGANLAFDYLCDRLGVDRDGLAFDPSWIRPPLPTVPPAGTGADQ